MLTIRQHTLPWCRVSSYYFFLLATHGGLNYWLCTGQSCTTGEQATTQYRAIMLYWMQQLVCLAVWLVQSIDKTSPCNAMCLYCALGALQPDARRVGLRTAGARRPRPSVRPSLLCSAGGYCIGPVYTVGREAGDLHQLVCLHAPRPTSAWCNNTYNPCRHCSVYIRCTNCTPTVRRCTPSHPHDHYSRSITNDCEQCPLTPEHVSLKKSNK